MPHSAAIIIVRAQRPKQFMKGVDHRDDDDSRIALRMLKKISSKAAAKGRRRTISPAFPSFRDKFFALGRYVEALRDAKTKLEGFFSILFRSFTKEVLHVRQGQS